MRKCVLEFIKVDLDPCPHSHLEFIGIQEFPGDKPLRMQQEKVVPQASGMA